MTLLKYADDMATHLTDANSLAAYHQQVDLLITLINESSLELNVSITKKLCCCWRVTPDNAFHILFQPVEIKVQVVKPTPLCMVCQICNTTHSNSGTTVDGSCTHFHKIINLNCY